MDPPPSLACAMGTTPAATNAAEPDDDAPAVCSGFHGLRTGPILGCSAEPLNPNSDICVLPKRIQSGAQIHPGPCAVGRHRMRIPRVGALHRRHALDGDVVLDERRHPVEVAAVRTRRPRAGPSAIERLIRQAIQRGVDGFGARDRRVDKLGSATRCLPEVRRRDQRHQDRQGRRRQRHECESCTDGTKAYRRCGEQSQEAPKPESSGTFASFRAG